MRAGDPLNAMAMAVCRALDRDLPPLKHKRRDGSEMERRPTSDEVEVYQFPQGWGSTALGFGGIGGQAMTAADTTVITSGDAAAVYFAGRLAYVVQPFGMALMEDIRAQDMAEVGRQRKYTRARSAP